MKYKKLKKAMILFIFLFSDVLLLNYDGNMMLDLHHTTQENTEETCIQPGTFNPFKLKSGDCSGIYCYLEGRNTQTDPLLGYYGHLVFMINGVQKCVYESKNMFFLNPIRARNCGIFKEKNNRLFYRKRGAYLKLFLSKITKQLTTNKKGGNEIVFSNLIQIPVPNLTMNTYYNVNNKNYIIEINRKNIQSNYYLWMEVGKFKIKLKQEKMIRFTATEDELKKGIQFYFMKKKIKSVMLKFSRNELMNMAKHVEIENQGTSEQISNMKTSQLKKINNDVETSFTENPVNNKLTTIPQLTEKSNIKKISNPQSDGNTFATEIISYNEYPRSIIETSDQLNIKEKTILDLKSIPSSVVKKEINKTNEEDINKTKNSTLTIGEDQIDNHKMTEGIQSTTISSVVEGHTKDIIVSSTVIKDQIKSTENEESMIRDTKQSIINDENISKSMEDEKKDKRLTYINSEIDQTVGSLRITETNQESIIMEKDIIEESETTISENSGISLSNKETNISQEKSNTMEVIKQSANKDITKHTKMKDITKDDMYELVLNYALKIMGMNGNLQEKVDGKNLKNMRTRFNNSQSTLSRSKNNYLNDSQQMYSEQEGDQIELKNKTDLSQNNTSSENLTQFTSTKNIPFKTTETDNSIQESENSDSNNNSTIFIGNETRVNNKMCPNDSIFMNGYCVFCGKNEYIKNNTCIACSENMEVNDIKNQCVCSSGYELINKVCIPCINGSYSKKGENCKLCKKGYRVNDEKSGCVKNNAFMTGNLSLFFVFLAIMLSILLLGVLLYIFCSKRENKDEQQVLLDSLA